MKTAPHKYLVTAVAIALAFIAALLLYLQV